MRDVDVTEMRMEMRWKWRCGADDVASWEMWLNQLAILLVLTLLPLGESTTQMRGQWPDRQHRRPTKP